MREKNYSDLIFKVNKNNMLLKAQIALTYRCNLKCRHCFESKDTNAELTLAEAKDILAQLGDLGAMTVSLTGGEVFLRQDFLEILEYARSLGLAVNILTNGTLLTEECVRQIKKFMPVDIRLSLYGTRRKTHELATRVSGSFKKTLRAIDLLKAYNIGFNVVFLVMRQNFDELAIFEALAKTKNWNTLIDYCVIPRINRSQEPLKFRITKGQIKRRVRALESDNNVNDSIPELDNYFDILSLGRNSCYISAQAEVFAHCSLRLKLGDLRKDSLRAIWIRSRAIKDLRKIQFRDFNCSKCSHNSYCCWDPGLSWLEHKDILVSPAWLCKLTNAGLRRDGKLLIKNLRKKFA